MMTRGGYGLAYVLLIRAGCLCERLNYLQQWIYLFKPTLQANSGYIEVTTFNNLDRLIVDIECASFEVAQCAPNHA